MGHLLSDVELADYLDGYSAEAREIVAALRNVILDAAPGVTEGIRYRALNYFLSGVPFGCIGGNVCLIDVRRGGVELGFVHGVTLPDRARLLRGAGKNKRDVPITSLKDARSPAIRRLIEHSYRAAIQRAEQAADE